MYFLVEPCYSTNLFEVGFVVVGFFGDFFFVWFGIFCFVLVLIFAFVCTFPW